MNEREFSKIFNRYYLPLCMYALRVTGDVDEARDSVQNAMEKAWREFGYGGGEVENLRAWLYRVVHNEAVGMLRRRRPVESLDSAGDVTDEEMDTSERDARLWRAIDSLPERRREVFLMSKRDGMSNQQIATELGITLQAVKNNMSRAYARLREALDDGRKVFFLPFL